MIDAITILSKYLMVLLMILYTIGAFRALHYRSVRDMRGCYYFLNFITLMFHGCGYLTIFLHERTPAILIFYGAQVIFILAYLLIYRLIYKKANLALLSHTIMFIVIGLIFLTRLDLTRAYRQMLFIILGAVVTLIVPALFSKVRAARTWGLITGVIGFLLLLAVLVQGRITGGAKLSLSFGNVSIQPSEFVKISYVLLMAVLFRERTDVKRILFAGILSLAHVGVLVLSTDLGAAVIYAVTFLMMLYVATRRPITLAIGAGVGAVGSVAAYLLFSHVQTRVQVWINPWQDYNVKGYQIGNALFGISTGGWFGQGLYQGNPKRIPTVVSDIIFAGICEEMGGIVGICIILICAACLLMFIHVAADLYLPFYKLTGIGLSTVYGVQVILNIGGVIKFIPSTGLTLPLVSFGINSLLSTFILFGIMQELYIKHQNEVDRIEESRGKHVLSKTR